MRDYLKDAINPSLSLHPNPCNPQPLAYQYFVLEWFWVQSFHLTKLEQELDFGLEIEILFAIPFRDQTTTADAIAFALTIHVI